MYRLLKKTDKFVWTEEADAALAQLKDVLSRAPILAAPKTREPMLLYMSATNLVISVVMVVERLEDGKETPEQRPVYYINKVFSASKQRYPHCQKLVYVFFFAS